MVHVVNSGNVQLYKAELEQSYLLRHRVFVEEKGWEAIRQPDGRDIDQFDTSSAVHMLVLQDQKVVGYSRLLPTTEPHLLTEVYPYLATLKIPRRTDIFEWTRYCIAPEKRGGTAVGNVGCRLLCGVVEYALSEGMDQLSMETDPIWITRFKELGFDVTPLGLPHKIDGEPVVAMTIGITEHAVKRCRRLLRVRGDLLQSRGTPHPVVPMHVAA